MHEIAVHGVMVPSHRHSSLTCGVGIDLHILMSTGPTQAARRKPQPSRNNPIAAIQLPATRTTTRAHAARRGAFTSAHPTTLHPSGIAARSRPH
jgi:hypothetical protein